MISNLLRAIDMVFSTVDLSPTIFSIAGISPILDFYTRLVGAYNKQGVAVVLHFNGIAVPFWFGHQPGLCEKFASGNPTGVLSRGCIGVFTAIRPAWLW